MEHYQEGQTQGTDERIPVSAQQVADRVVSFLREDHGKVHTAMENQEEHQRKAG